MHLDIMDVEIKQNYPFKNNHYSIEIFTFKNGTYAAFAYNQKDYENETDQSPGYVMDINCSQDAIIAAINQLNP